MRDYDKLKWDAWELLEKALGASYGDIEIGEEDGHIKASYQDKSIEVEGTGEEGLTELVAQAQTQVLAEALLGLKKALPSSLWNPLIMAANALLGIDHTVILGSKHTSKEELARDVLRQEYWKGVESGVDSLVADVKAGDITSNEDLDERIREQEIIYNSEAFTTLMFAKNDDAYWEESGEEAPGYCTIATYAYQADLRDGISKVGREVQSRNCLRCGEVTDFDLDDKEECPKCQLSFDVTEERAGGVEHREWVPLRGVRKRTQAGGPAGADQGEHRLRVRGV